MVAITPAIEGLFFLDHRDAATILVDHIPSLVLFSVFGTGLVLTFSYQTAF